VSVNTALTIRIWMAGNEPSSINICRPWPAGSRKFYIVSFSQNFSGFVRRSELFHPVFSAYGRRILYGAPVGRAPGGMGQPRICLAPQSDFIRGPRMRSGFLYGPRTIFQTPYGARTGCRTLRLICLNTCWSVSGRLPAPGPPILVPSASQLSKPSGKIHNTLVETLFQQTCQHMLRCSRQTPKKGYFLTFRHLNALISPFL
jgi:hypothetical protein